MPFVEVEDLILAGNLLSLSLKIYLVLRHLLAVVNTQFQLIYSSTLIRIFFLFKLLLSYLVVYRCYRKVTFDPSLGIHYLKNNSSYKMFQPKKKKVILDT